MSLLQLQSKSNTQLRELHSVKMLQRCLTSQDGRVYFGNGGIITQRVVGNDALACCLPAIKQTYRWIVCMQSVQHGSMTCKTGQDPDGSIKRA